MEYFVTELKTLKQNGVMQVVVAYRDILLIYKEDMIYAIQDRCPHKGISLVNGTIKNNIIKCKDHGLPISLESGEVTNDNQANFLRLDQDSRRIPTYPVSIRNNKVFIKI